MNIESIVKESFTVIGKEGSTSDGEGFIKKLWQDANIHFEEIAALVKRDAQGMPVGFWGAMSDMSRSFKPWDDFNKGLYLAGAECEDEAQQPEGWIKWIIPGYEYLKVENEDENTFSQMLEYMQERNLPLAGAVHDYTCPRTGTNYILFPIRKL